MINLENIEEQFSKQKVNKAKRMILREFEEERKNHFICFVDEESQSYDVKIVLNSTSEIEESSCDCMAKDFCAHQLAVAIFISQKQSGKKVSKRSAKKKISEAELAMENLNSEEIKMWLLEFFKKNKDAEMQFLLEYGETKKEFSDDEIKNAILKTTHSVAGKKKNLTAQDVKKIVDLLTKVLQPVEEFLFQNVNKEISVEKFFLINEIIIDFQMSVYTSSSRLEKFSKNLILRFAANFNSVKNFEEWKKLAEKYWTDFFEDKKPLRIYFYEFIKEMYHSGSSEQKLFIAELVKKQIVLWMKNDVNLRVSIKEDLLTIVSENGFFNELHKYFPIVQYENSYNVKVINEIIKTDFSLAEKLCKKMISLNNNDKYNYPYFEILEKKYSESNNLQGLAFVKRGIFNNNLNIEDFIFIDKNEADREAFKKFRNRIMSGLRNSFYSDVKYVELYYEILDYEKNYKKMIEVLDAKVSNNIINKYAEKMYNTDKNKFLDSFKKRFFWGELNEEDYKVADFLVSKYDVLKLKEVFSKNGFGLDKFKEVILSKI